MPYADEIDTSSAISSMADDLDQAADVVSQGIGSPNTGIREEALVTRTEDAWGRPIDPLTPSYQGDDVSLSGMGIGPGNIGAEVDPMMGAGPLTEVEGGSETFTGRIDPRGDQRTPMGGGPSMAPDVTNLGDKPSIQAMQAAIESVGGGPEMGGGPADMIAGLMGEEEVAEEVAPGEEVATFLSDFDRGMSAKSPAGMISQGGVQEISPNIVDQIAVQGGSSVPSITDPASGIPGSLRNRNIQSQMGGGPSDLHEAPLGSYDYEAGRINEPAPKSSMERLYESITNLGGSQMGAGGPDVPGMLRHDAGYDVIRDPHSTAMGTPNQAYLASQAGPDIPGVTSFEGTPVDQVAISGGAVAPQDVAPKYSGETVTVETQDQMYPGHKNFATLAGVSSVLSTINGSHAGWIDAVNKDMVARGIELSHTVDGKSPNGIAFGQPGSNLSGKHASGDWKEYSALFDPETGLDSNGVPMPGTAGAPVEEVAVQQGSLSPLETGANTFGEVYDDVRAAPVGGDDTRGDNPIDIIRSTYTWASSLPNNVLFNAARYPDYLRLLIEYDAAGKDLPLTVPTWILEGTARPAEDDEEQTSLFANHPAMQTQELTWAT